MSASVNRLFARRTETVDLYRPQAMVDGKRSGALDLIVSGLVVKRWPLSTQPGADKIVAGDAAALARATHLVFVRQAVTLKPGDELRQGNRVDKVEGVGRWKDTIAVAVSEVYRAQPTP